MDSATLAKQMTEPAPTEASPRPTCIIPTGDLRPEKGEFTHMGVKFIFSEFQLQ